MKILLVSIPLEFPLANYCLAAQLSASPQTADCTVELLNLDAARLNTYHRKSTEIWRYIAHVEQLRPDVIAFSVYLWSNLATAELISITAKLYPNIAIIVGGPEVATPEAVESWLARGTVKAAVRGEGELTLVDVIARLRTGDHLAGVEGCSWYNDGSVIHERRRPPVKDLYQLSSPYLTGWVPDQLLKRVGSTTPASFPRAFLETYRGCYMQCSYCQWGNGSKSRSDFPLDRVRGELTWLLSRNVDAIWIVDAMFGYKKAVAKEILRHVIDEKRRFDAHTHIVCYHNQDFFDPELFDLYREANVSVEVDLQSVAMEVLVRVGRAKWYTDSFDRHLEAFHRQNVPTTGAADLIIGLPADRLETFGSSIDFLLERGMNINLYQTSIIPDTPMSRSVAEDGTVFSDIAPRAVFRNKTFSTFEMIQARLMGHGVDFFARYPKVAELLWRRAFSRPSEFCLRVGQLLWDERGLMYGESHTNEAVLADAQKILFELLPKLCLDEWLLPIVRNLFSLEAAASRMAIPPAHLPPPPVLSAVSEGYPTGELWLSDRPRFRREAVEEVQLDYRIDRVLKAWDRSGKMPDDAAWRGLAIEPTIALVFVLEANRPSYRVVDRELTHALLMRFNGYFSIAECLDNLIGDWRSEELSHLHEMLSGLLRTGLIETGAPPVRRQRSPESLLV